MEDSQDWSIDIEIEVWCAYNRTRNSPNTITEGPNHLHVPRPAKCGLLLKHNHHQLTHPLAALSSSEQLTPTTGAITTYSLTGKHPAQPRSTVWTHLDLLGSACPHGPLPCTTNHRVPQGAGRLYLCGSLSLTVSHQPPVLDLPNTYIYIPLADHCPRRPARVGTPPACPEYMPR